MQNILCSYNKRLGSKASTNIAISGSKAQNNADQVSTNVGEVTASPSMTTPEPIMNWSRSLF